MDVDKLAVAEKVEVCRLTRVGEMFFLYIFYTK